MNPAPPAKPARLAADVAKPVSLSAKAKALLTPALTPRQYFDALAAAALQEDAIRFLALALPKREAVWWGCVCLKDAVPPPPVAAQSPARGRAAPAPPPPTPPADPAARAAAAAELWTKDPSEPNRRAAGAAADAAGYDTPPGLLAAAAFWSGGSLAPPDLPVVPPREELTGIAVGGALVLAAIDEPEKAAATRARFLAAGTEIASGKGK